MDMLTFDILLVTTIVAFTILGGLIGWFLGYRDGLRKATKKQMRSMNHRVVELKGNIGKRFLSPFTEIVDNLRLNDSVVTKCYRCGAPASTHYHGCPYAAQWQFITIAKPGG